MTDRLDRIRKTWELSRRRFDFSKFDAWTAVLHDVTERPYLFEQVPTAEKVDIITFTAERCYYINDGELYKWCNIICEGHIIDMEWIS